MLLTAGDATRWIGLISYPIQTMTQKLCIFVCKNFLPEVQSCITAEWENVVAVAFPSNCGHPPMQWQDFTHGLPPDCDQVLILGNACLKGLPDNPPEGFPASQILPLKQCFHLVAPPQLVDDLLADGTYLITPGWLADWQGELNKMGFSEDQAKPFYHDFAKQLVLLDTGVDAESEARLAQMQAAIDLPVRRTAVGLDYIRLFLGKQLLTYLLRWEQANQLQLRNTHAQQLANHVSAMDMVAQLSTASHENEAVDSIVDMFQMLFAPQEIYYLREENEQTMPIGAIPDEWLEPLRSLHSGYAWTDDEQGFLIRITSGEKVMGRIAVCRLTFPERRKGYLNMALAISGVCGLVVENARNRKKLLEAEKMASLGVLVAGVAHEVNTPLGIGLTAASDIQTQSRKLAKAFHDRSMTQSSLDAYLQTVEKENQLLQSNLLRISELITEFHKVAINDSSQEKRRFLFCSCLDNVIRSFGKTLTDRQVVVRIDCDRSLQIDSRISDWVSIFNNLIGNSLKHGFDEHQGGSVNILVTKEEGLLKVEYQDSGQGMQQDILAKQFEPFLTGNLQRGMGLGMHLVYNLVTQSMAGTIHGDSQSGKGVHYVIKVPL
ncbi:MAG: DUF1638 domain-containing protein [Candidatus Thiodiazotropha sp. (ex. Lucinisca nassula)]|nr:DUF1638 domain-containing protein [Candidatus Thiodiazotropha sp. (ex. Lucinisca nassula)]MBW9263367.1 DUF1638 domain-containing protein [Candidatus Thiodiazotropha sp. (ex. Lucinisca nassula)]